MKVQSTRRVGGLGPTIFIIWSGTARRHGGNQSSSLLDITVRQVPFPLRMQPPILKKMKPREVVNTSEEPGQSTAILRAALRDISSERFCTLNSRLTDVLSKRFQVYARSPWVSETCPNEVEHANCRRWRSAVLFLLSLLPQAVKNRDVAQVNQAPREGLFPAVTSRDRSKDSFRTRTRLDEKAAGHLNHKDSKTTRAQQRVLERLLINRCKSRSRRSRRIR